MSYILYNKCCGDKNNKMSCIYMIYGYFWSRYIDLSVVLHIYIYPTSYTKYLLYDYVYLQRAQVLHICIIFYLRFKFPWYKYTWWHINLHIVSLVSKHPCIFFNSSLSLQLIKKKHKFMWHKILVSLSV